MKLSLLDILCSRDKNEKNEMGRTSRAYGGEESGIQGFGGEI